MRVCLILVATALVLSCSASDKRLTPSTPIDQDQPQSVDLERQSYTLKSGPYTSCFLYNNNRLRCWGKHDYRSSARRPKVISLGLNFLCGIDSNDQLFCLNPEKDPAIKVPIEWQGTTISSVISGKHHICAIDTSGRLRCQAINQEVPVRVPNSLQGRSYSQVSAASEHACALDTNQKAYCWGRNDQQQASIPNTLRSKTFVKISTADNHSCAIDNEESLYCWGAVTVDRSVTNDHYITVESRDQISCAINRSKDLHCYGSNQNLLTEIADGTARFKYLQVAVGQGFVCAVRTNRSTQCWGSDDEFGQLQPGSLP